MSQVHELEENNGFAHLRSANSLWRGDGCNGGRFSEYTRGIKCNGLGTIYRRSTSDKESSVRTDESTCSSFANKVDELGKETNYYYDA